LGIQCGFVFHNGADLNDIFGVVLKLGKNASGVIDEVAVCFSLMVLCGS
jgi:hypothetical protein